MDSQFKTREHRIHFSLRALFKLTLVVAAILAIGTLRRWQFPEHELFSLLTLATLVPIFVVLAIDLLRLVTPRSLVFASIALYVASMVVHSLSWQIIIEGPSKSLSCGWQALYLSFLGAVIPPSQNGNPFLLWVACLMGASANIAFLLGTIRWRNSSGIAILAAYCSVLLLIFASVGSTQSPLPILLALHPGCGIWLASMLGLWLGIRAEQQEIALCFDNADERLLL